MAGISDYGYVESPGFFGPAEREDADPPGVRRFYGKYRGSVVSNVDPLGKGRLLVSVPDVFGVLPSSWALPCVPLAGQQMGVLPVPAVNAGVWVEFEQGNPEYPIWVGFFWGSSSELPGTATTLTPGTAALVVETAGKSKVVVTDTPVSPMNGGGVLLQSGSASITVDSSGVTITASQIKLVGTVDMNNGALLVKSS
jgi:hypothetical protein